MVSVLSRVLSMVSCYTGSFQRCSSYQGSFQWFPGKLKGFGSIRMIFKYFCNIITPRSEGPPFRLFHPNKQGPFNGVNVLQGPSNGVHLIQVIPTVSRLTRVVPTVSILNRVLPTVSILFRVLPTVSR